MPGRKPVFSASDIERAIALIAAGATRKEAAAAIGMTFEGLRYRLEVLTQAGQGLKGVRSDTKVSRERVMSLVAEGHKDSDIARMCGVHRSRIARIKIWQPPPERYRGMLVPDWVPKDLRDDYVDHARDFNPAWAGRHVRRLMAEAA